MMSLILLGWAVLGGDYAMSEGLIIEIAGRGFKTRRADERATGAWDRS
jgi:hypothetical protein